MSKRSQYLDAVSKRIEQHALLAVAVFRKSGEKDTPELITARRMDAIYMQEALLLHKEFGAIVETVEGNLKTWEKISADEREVARSYIDKVFTSTEYLRGY